MELFPGGIATCHVSGVNGQAEGEGIHGKSYHHRRRSRKERVSGARCCARRVCAVPEEAGPAAVRPSHLWFAPSRK